MRRKGLHQEDNEGGWTMREYIEVNGTEKAYDSGLDVGKSINTPSMTAAVKTSKTVGNWSDTFVLIRLLFCLEKLVPFILTLLCEKTFWDPSKKICQSEGLL